MANNCKLENGNDFCGVEYFEADPCPVCGCEELYFYWNADLKVEECPQCHAAELEKDDDGNGDGR